MISKYYIVYILHRVFFIFYKSCCLTMTEHNKESSGIQLLGQRCCSVLVHVVMAGCSCCLFSRFCVASCAALSNKTGRGHRCHRRAGSFPGTLAQLPATHKQPVTSDRSRRCRERRRQSRSRRPPPSLRVTCRRILNRASSTVTFLVL